MSTTLEKKTGKYTAEQVEQGIMALALHNGSSRGAERLLKEQGLAIPQRTLQDWKTRYAKRLEEAEKRANDEIWSRTSRKFRRIVDETQDVALEAVAATKQAIDSDDARAASSWSATAKNLTIVTGIGTEKAAGIEGRPMTHADPKDINTILKGLERYSSMVKVNWQTIDSEAKDVTPQGSELALSAPSVPSGDAHSHSAKAPAPSS